VSTDPERAAIASRGGY